MERYRIVDQPIGVEAVLAEMADPACGGQTVFTGTVRNHFEGRASRGLIYEVYRPMAEAEMARIGKEILAKHDISHFVMIHRVGRLDLGEISVLVAAAAAHRDAAFAAAREGIERLKAEVPIWKKELWADGNAVWHHDPDAAGTGTSGAD